MTGRRTHRRVTAAVLLAALVGGCSGGGPRDDGAEDGGDVVARAAALCTEVLNERDAEAFEAGEEASTGVLAAHLEDPGTPPDDVDDLRTSLEVLRDELTAARDRLADGVVADEVEAWDEVVLEPIDDRVAVLDERIAAASAEGWADADLGPDRTAGADLDALAEVGLAGRDCEVIATSSGPLADSPDFAAAAADACRVVVDRRRLDDHADDARRSVEAVADVLEDGRLDDTDGLDAALADMVEEWQATYDDLRAVPADELDGDLGGAWSATVQLAEDRADGYEERREALESEEGAAVEDAFRPETLGEPGWEWETVGLEQRDCRSVQA